MKKILILMFLCIIPSLNAAEGSFIKRWVSEKLEHPSTTIKKAIDLSCLLLDLTTTRDTAIITENRYLDATVAVVKVISKWVDIKKLEKCYIRYYRKEHEKRIHRYKQKKAEQKR